MIELIDGINYHNYLLDSKPESWFKRYKEETVGEWLKRTAYQGDGYLFSNLIWRQRNNYWLESSQKITVFILSFLRENKIEKEVFEDLVEFEVDLHGSFDYTINQIRKMELITNKKLV